MVYSHEKYLQNKEAAKAAQKRYYLKNREKILARQKKYDSEHKEQINKDPIRVSNSTFFFS
jgi:hypothetical protein